MVQIPSWLHSTFKELSNDYSHAQIRVKTKKLWPRQVGEKNRLLSGSMSRQEMVSRQKMVSRQEMVLGQKMVSRQKTCVATRSAEEKPKIGRKLSF